MCIVMKIPIHLVDIYCNVMAVQSVEVYCSTVYPFYLYSDWFADYQIFWHRYNGRDASNASTDMQDIHTVIRSPKHCYATTSSFSPS